MLVTTDCLFEPATHPVALMALEAAGYALDGDGCAARARARPHAPDRERSAFRHDASTDDFPDVRR